MSSIKTWIGNYLTCAVKEKFHIKMTLVTSLIGLTFILALIGFILSIVAVHKLNTQLSTIDLTNKIIIQGVSYYRII